MYVVNEDEMNCVLLTSQHSVRNYSLCHYVLALVNHAPCRIPVDNSLPGLVYCGIACSSFFDVPQLLILYYRLGRLSANSEGS